MPGVDPQPPDTGLGGHGDPHYRPGMPGYVLRDWDVVDYECFQLPGSDHWFRGPAPADLEPGSYFTAIGAAQTFGCFTALPYPRLVAERLGIEALNLGYSGAGPAFFLRQPNLIEHINRGRFCILQVMSARSTSNSLLDNPLGLAYGRRRSDGRPITAEQVFDDLVTSEIDRLPTGNARLKRAALRATGLPLPPVRRVVRESRQDWLIAYRQLLEAITVPTVLLWFSTRQPRYPIRYHRASHLLGAYPHLVDRSMVLSLQARTRRYVECVSDRGLPQPLVDRFSGEPTEVDLRRDRKDDGLVDPADVELYAGVWRENAYYPSPEMHEDAAAMLAFDCAGLLQDERGKRVG